MSDWSSDYEVEVLNKIHVVINCPLRSYRINAVGGGGELSQILLYHIRIDTD